MMVEVETLHDEKTNLTAFVVPQLTKGDGWNVRIRDDDTGKFLPLEYVGIPSANRARAKARDLIRLGYALRQFADA
jgi:hypothetical protein